MEPTKQRERPVLPWSQPYGNDAHGTPAQASEHAAAATGLDGMSFEDTLWKYIPEDSDLALSIKQRKCVYSFRGDNSFTLGPEEAVLSAHEVLGYFSDLYGPSSPIHRTLIIQDINLDWCKALCSGFPGAIDPDFIARHIIHFDKLPAVYEMEDLQNDLTKRYPHAGTSIESSGNFLGVQMSLSNYAIGGNGFHIDLQIEPSSSEAQQHIRYLRNARPFASQWDFFERDESNKWRRRSTRVSCCRLEECFCKSEGSYHSQSTVAKKLYPDLVLVNLIPDYGKSAEFSRLKSRDFFHRALHVSSPSTFAKAPRLPLECHHTTEHSNILSHQLSKLFSFHTTQSVFKPWSYPPSTWLYQMNAQIFIWLLTEANWRAAVAYLEDQLQHLRQEATVVPSDRAFEILTGLRRQIVNAQSLMAGTWSQVEYESKSHYSFWHADEAILTADEFWSQSRDRNVSVSSHQARTYDIRDIPGMIKASEDRLGSMAKELNEEIQVMIGSVGVVDLKISRRSTEWTVVLAVLATIYLPMMLVAGIFGMNIKEITGDTALDRWSTVKVWGVVFGATIGSILLYAGVRYVSRYWRVVKMLALQSLDEHGRFDRARQRFHGLAHLSMMLMRMEARSIFN
ncbi:hypothetical protein Q7P37_006203 [Cladosporium fusiforme]